jgi:hypothetical protein
MVPERKGWSLRLRLRIDGPKGCRTRVEVSEPFGVGEDVDLDDLPPVTVKPITAMVRPSLTTVTPTVPLTSTGVA